MKKLTAPGGLRTFKREHGGKASDGWRAAVVCSIVRLAGGSGGYGRTARDDSGLIPKRKDSSEPNCSAWCKGDVTMATAWATRQLGSSIQKQQELADEVERAIFNGVGSEDGL